MRRFVGVSADLACLMGYCKQFTRTKIQSVIIFSYFVSLFTLFVFCLGLETRVLPVVEG